MFIFLISPKALVLLKKSFCGFEKKIMLKNFETPLIDQLLKWIKKLTEYYKNYKFVKILKQNKLISTNDVINTNNCHISVCKTKYKNKVIILSAIDNLIKGGAGQAVQNLNIKFNFPKNTALL